MSATQTTRKAEPKHRRLNSPEIQAAYRISAFYQKIFEKHGLPSVQITEWVTPNILADIIAGVEPEVMPALTPEQEAYHDSFIDA